MRGRAKTMKGPRVHVQTAALRNAPAMYLRVEVGTAGGEPPDALRCGMRCALCSSRQRTPPLAPQPPSLPKAAAMGPCPQLPHACQDGETAS